jgi:hypothetical protein
MDVEVSGPWDRPSVTGVGRSPPHPVRSVIRRASVGERGQASLDRDQSGPGGGHGDRIRRVDRRWPLGRRKAGLVGLDEKDHVAAWPQQRPGSGQDSGEPIGHYRDSAGLRAGVQVARAADRRTLAPGRRRRVVEVNARQE